MATAIIAFIFPLTAFAHQLFALLYCTFANFTAQRSGMWSKTTNYQRYKGKSKKVASWRIRHTHVLKHSNTRHGESARGWSIQTHLAGCLAHGESEELAIKYYRHVWVYMCIDIHTYTYSCAICCCNLL